MNKMDVAEIGKGSDVYVNAWHERRRRETKSALLCFWVSDAARKAAYAFVAAATLQTNPPHIF